MRFSTTFAVFSALAAAAQAVNFTVLTFATVTAGQPFELTWTGAAGPVSLILKNGPALDLKTVSTIASGLSGGSYTWEVPSTLTNLETYALEITDGVTTNYSTQFQLIGGVAATGSASQSGTASQTGSVTRSATTSVATLSLSTTITEVTVSGSSTIPTGTRTSTGVVTSRTAATTPTSTPPSGAASGLSSNVALVLLAAGALFMIN